MRTTCKQYLLFVLLSLCLGGCRSKTATAARCRFTQMAPAATRIDFNNAITETDSVNVFTNEYMYNGAGAGTGDFNNDGLQDIFLCGSMVGSKLYINKGNWVFEDITQQAGIATSSWCTGVSIADINNDGFPDLYICVSHSASGAARKNQLFINDGKLHFTEQAAAYGLADTGYSTQAAFLDYDKDGDLDMYLLNHRLYSHTANNLQPKDTSGHSPAQDKLYRNNGIPAGLTHAVYQDVSLEAGIKEDGYGLGLVVTDVNNDNWPDIYVANDYIGNDLLWLNNKNGSFTNIIASAIRHQSYNSMGADAADINNDLLPDIAVLDMLPETNERKKMMSAATNQEKFDMQQRFGYQPSYVRNMLQLNNGNRQRNGRDEPFYSEIGQLAGIFQTDWSWSMLMADFDNDGWKDIHITNGLGKDVTNNDYNAFANAGSQTSSYTFGSNRADEALDRKTIATLRATLDKYGSVPMNNYFFLNNHQLGFTDQTAQAGINIPSVSNGAVYADLDNDGDLDLLVNNMNQPVFAWKNETRQSVSDSTANFISIQLKGPAGNTGGLGSRVSIHYSRGQRQLAEQSPVRGFCSSVDNRLHFGIGNTVSIDSVIILWPDNKMQLLKNVSCNRLLTLNYRDAQPAALPQAAASTPYWFSDAAVVQQIDFKHAETPNYDFGYHQPLLQKYSQLGPCLATGDVNGDGLVDFFAGGAAQQSGKLFVQKPEGGFATSALDTGSKAGEDLGAVFFDADGDKDLDLLVTGGSFEFTVAAYNQPRLYLNDGKGRFTMAVGALPEITVITKAVAVADYDSDGDMDVFIGGRLQPLQYPQSPRSYLLQNNRGKFTDVTAAVCAGLESPGMVTGALFTDFDNDRQPDLLICGEWMPLRFFKNTGHQLKEIYSGIANSSGLWRCLQQADIDKDGDMDYIAGNTGLNNRYNITAETPLLLYTKDIGSNGFIEMVPAYYIKDRSAGYRLYPALDRNQLAEQVPGVKKKYLLHSDYAAAAMQQLQENFGMEDWRILKCEMAATVWIENLGNGKFLLHQLPLQAQFAPVNSIVSADIDADGYTDLLIAGNEYQADAGTGRYDASYGLVLRGGNKKQFTADGPAQNGFLLDGDVRDMKWISTKNNERLLLAAVNDSRLSAFLLKNTAGQ